VVGAQLELTPKSSSTEYFAGGGKAYKYTRLCELGDEFEIKLGQKRIRLIPVVRSTRGMRRACKACYG